MSEPLWVHEMASFWQEVAPQDSFPRDLQHAVVRALPITAVELPNLRVAEIDRWLRSQGVVCRLQTRDRPLYGCLVAHNSHGAVFLDARDPEAERRFTLAHELAHFLHDYWKPRREAVTAYGPDVLEVFDGIRTPRPEERVHALLAAIPIGWRVHLTDRDEAAQIGDPAIARAERDADRLACELLAPESDVLDRIAPLPESERQDAARALLRSRYGLPPGPAARYATLLAPRPESSFTRRLWAVR